MNEQARKIVHLIFGVAIAVVILLLPREESIMLFSGSLLVGIVLADLVKSGHRVPLVTFLVLHLEREGEFPGKGAICFVVSSLFCTVFFPLSRGSDWCPHSRCPRFDICTRRDALW